MEPNKPVENPVNAGTQAGVEAISTIAPVEEADLLKEYQRLMEENKRLAEDRDNYRAGMLKYKKGEPSVPLEEEEIEKRALERANTIIIQKERDAAAAKANEIALQALKENRELKLALKSKTATATAPVTASNTGIPTSSTSFWTPEQIAALKARGVDPEKAKENYLRMKA